MVEFNLKPSENSDIDFVFRVKVATLKSYIEEIWGWDEKWQYDALKKEFIKENNQIILIDNEAIGILEINDEAHLCNIAELEIMPEYQGRGIGSSILNEIIAKKVKESKTIIIGCFKRNEGALKLYMRLGFVKFDETNTHIILKYEG